MTTLHYRLKYVAWLLPAATLVLTLSASGRDVVQRGGPGNGTPQQQTQPAAPVQQGGPARMGGPQGPPTHPGSGFGEWWKDEIVVKELALTPQLVRNIDRIYQDRLKRLASFAEETQKLGIETRKMVDERTVDEATYALQAWREWSMRARFAADSGVMQYRQFLELSPEQHKKLMALREKDRERARAGRGAQWQH